MLKLVGGLLIAALIAAFFGFGGVANEFADIARILFYLFAALFLASAVASLFSRRWPAGAHAARTLGLVAVVAAASVGVYAWIDNDMTAERLGRALDRETVEVASSTSEALDAASERTERFLTATVEDIRTDAQRAADAAREKDEKENAP
ncbi:MAG: DUF1328 domain-containing protein [Hyphomonadaceae bacterium]|nr:DUF1328 domain-containing protein [Hyphomonadaceae bacterium]